MTKPTIRDEAWRYADPKALEVYVPAQDEAPKAISGEVVEVAILAPGSSAASYVVQPGAHLIHVAQFSVDAPAFSKVSVEVQEGGRFSSFAFNDSSAYIRNEIHVELTGKGAHADLRGAYMLKGTGHSDTLTKVHHVVADTTSDEIYKGVLSERGRGVFQAQIRVAPDAQRIVGNQMHRALMLSDDARVDTKPELEIFADDVQCSHGSTIGELEEQHLFYLASRGVPQNEAKRLLIKAFLAEIFEDMPEAALADIEARQEAYLSGL